MSDLHYGAHSAPGMLDGMAGAHRSRERDERADGGNAPRAPPAERQCKTRQGPDRAAQLPAPPGTPGRGRENGPRHRERDRRLWIGEGRELEVESRRSEEHTSELQS